MQQPDSSTHVILRGPVVKALVPATAAVRPPSCTATAAEEADDEETPEDATHEKAPEDATHEEAASYLSVQSLEAEFLPILFRFKLEPVLGPAVQPRPYGQKKRLLHLQLQSACCNRSSEEAAVFSSRHTPPHLPWSAFLPGPNEVAIHCEAPPSPLRAALA
ncbi:hypothetical protein cyc_00171 [Cyclospora cayetanensis]|uniref:Uncharacterized protein n=1 Tax=Cyclospora cayetanensis TaxID=88456 RepID=A0A1D3CXM7_9EIME|nr:hypothetical protein cyc_00171 [Cyclospora cayetanensis]